MSSLTIKNWTSADIPLAQRAAALEAAVLSQPCPFRTQSQNPAPVAEMYYAQVAETSVLRYRGETSRLLRGAKEIAAATPDNLAIMACDSSVDLVEEDRRFSLRSGDLYLYHPSRKLELIGGDRLGISTFCVASGLIESAHAQAWIPLGAVLPRENATTRLLRAVLTPLLDLARDLPETAFLSTLRHAAQVAALEAGGRTHERAREAKGRLRLHRAQALIERRHRDTAFGPAAAARELGCSVRLVHQMFEGADRSFGTHLLEARLRTAWKVLAAPDHDQRTITQIAFESGFNDLSTFHRAFRRMFGVSPRDVRSRLI
ncbi:MAG: helix-turn-helix domain-containing protein [Phycisphaerales bacterium]|nr:helix-turn-helix domain-containing protein [Hyphomonadaceae bacterium]